MRLRNEIISVVILVCISLLAVISIVRYMLVRGDARSLFVGSRTIWQHQATLEIRSQYL
jgi:hypothetical protein